MTLFFIDGFENWSNAHIGGTGWSGALYPESGGRWGGRRGKAQSSSITYYFPTGHQEIIIGWAYKEAGGMTYTDFQLGPDTNLILRVNSSGSITLYRGGSYTLLDSSNNSILDTESWNYFEIKAKIANTGGYYKVRLNGVPIPSLPDATNVDTCGGTNEYISSWRLVMGDPFESVYVDDMYFGYVDSTPGSVNNDFLGDVRIEALYPVAAGSNTEWTPVGVTSNWAAVDEAQPDEGSTYVAASSIGAKDLYTMSDLATAAGTVYAVQIDIRATKDDSGTRGIQGVFKSGASEADTTSFGTVPATYQYFRELREHKPGGTGWTIDEVNGMEIGVKVSL